MKNCLSITGFLLLALSIACGGQQSDADRALMDRCEEWIVSNGQAPVAYVVSLFDQHDVVILGEWHRIEHQLQFVQDLIPAVYAQGVTVLGTEFARAADQDLIDSLLAAETWQPALARQIQFQWNPLWAGQGYLDIYHAAWEFNQSLDDGREPFRILGLNCSTDWSFIKKQSDMEVDSLRRLVWQGCGEKDWAAIVLKQVQAGKKVLAYCGMHHAFSEYMHPIVGPDGKFIRVEDDRFGRYLYNEIGKRVVTVALHGPWYDSSGYNGQRVRPADGMIDDIMMAASTGPVGFSLKNSPFGELQPRNAVYRIGHHNFRLADFCDGWIWHKPFSSYVVTPYVDSFVNSANVDQARRQAADPWYRDATVEQFVLYGRRFFESQQKMMNEL